MHDLAINPHTSLMRKACFPPFIITLPKYLKGSVSLARGEDGETTTMTSWVGDDPVWCPVRCPVWCGRGAALAPTLLRPPTASTAQPKLPTEEGLLASSHGSAPTPSPQPPSRPLSPSIVLARFSLKGFWLLLRAGILCIHESAASQTVPQMFCLNIT